MGRHLGTYPGWRSGKRTVDMVAVALGVDEIEMVGEVGRVDRGHWAVCFKLTLMLFTLRASCLQ